MYARERVAAVPYNRCYPAVATAVYSLVAEVILAERETSLAELDILERAWELVAKYDPERDTHLARLVTVRYMQLCYQKKSENEI